MFQRGVPRILSSDQMGDRGKVPAVSQAGIRRLNDVVLTPMRRDAVASTLVKRHFDHLFLLDLKRYAEVSELEQRGHTETEFMQRREICFLKA